MVIRNRDSTLFPAKWKVEIPPAPPARAQVAGVGVLISRSVEVIRARFADVSKVVLIAAGAAVLLQTIATILKPAPGGADASAALGGGVIAGILFLIAAILFVWMQNSLTLLVGADRLGVEMKGEQALVEGLEAVPAGIWTRVVQFFILAPAFLALIVPGVILMVRFCVAMQISAFERRSGLDALRASNELVRNRAWSVFSRLFAFWLVQMGFAMVFGIAAGLFAAVTLGLIPGLTLVGSFISLVASGFAIAFYSVWRTHFYLALVDEERALDPTPPSPAEDED